jgi:hypothetical protein
MKFLQASFHVRIRSNCVSQRPEKAKPQLDQEQVAGRSLLWDKAPLDLDRKSNLEARIAQQAYVYQNKG